MPQRTGDAETLLETPQGICETMGYDFCGFAHSMVKPEEYTHGYVREDIARNKRRNPYQPDGKKGACRRYSLATEKLASISEPHRQQHSSDGQDVQFVVLDSNAAERSHARCSPEAWKKSTDQL